MELIYAFGEWENKANATVQDAENLCIRAAELRSRASATSLEDIFSLLESVRKCWETSPEKELCRQNLPSLTGFSKEMVEVGLEAIPDLLDPKSLRQKVNQELHGIPRLPEEKFFASSNTSLFFEPIGTVLHVVAGNVFLGALGSLIEGVITGNVSIIKMSSDEKFFLPLFLRVLQRTDKDSILSNLIACIAFSSSETSIIEIFKKNMDGVVVWGGETAIRGWRDNLPARTRFITFGPKYSFAWVSHKGFQTTGVDSVAERIARDISIWDQNACTSPQICYVEGRENAIALTEALHLALERTEARMPAGTPSSDAAIEIQKLRGVFEIAEGRGLGLLRASKGNVCWTVVCDSDGTPDPSPLHRTLRIVPVNSQAEVIGHLASLRGYLQTAGVLVSSEEVSATTSALADLGVQRVLELGKMNNGEIDDPHDGQYDLPQYLNLVCKRVGNRPPWEEMSEERRSEIINRRLRTLVQNAKRAPYYREILGDVRTTDDLAKVPVLTRQIFEQEMSRLATGSWNGGYVSRSGGSTGEPRFSIYDRHDWDQMISHAYNVLRLAGLSSTDRVANCFLAGDLYGSFVSFDHINAKTGVTTFGFANAAKAPLLVKTWREFGLNTIMGVPAFVVPILREAKALDPQFELEKFIFAGQPIARVDREWLLTDCGVKRVASVIGANDGGQIAVQCECMDGNLHHTVDDFNFMEIVDEEGRRLPDGTQGRILITSLLKFAYPLIRYEIGDSAKIEPGVCACGRTLRRLRYLGRFDLQIPAGMLNISFQDLETALACEKISAMQVRVWVNQGKDSVDFRLESDSLTSADNSRIRTFLLRKFPMIERRLQEGALAEIRVFCLKPGEIPRDPRTGKLKGVSDERI
jgi:phenylacetate-CoA ligase